MILNLSRKLRQIAAAASPDRAASVILFGCIAVALSGRANAAVINAKSPAQTDVATAVVLARNGDTVIVPAGTAHWTTPVTITKFITLQGAGTTLDGVGNDTIIYCDVAGNSSLNVSLPSEVPSNLAYSFRLTGFEFRATPGSGGGSAYNGYETAFYGTSLPGQNPLVVGCTSKFRLDHCYWLNTKYTSVQVKNLIGVIDHCTITRPQAPIHIMHTNWTPPGQSTLSINGYGSWADDPYWGTEKFLYLEDVNLNYTGSAPVNYGVDAYEGARYVIRHSKLSNSGFTGHGSEGRAPRGTKQIDVYDNDISYSSLKKMSQGRSGTWLMHDNRMVNVDEGPKFQLYRLTRAEKDWGPASGFAPIDENSGSASIFTGTYDPATSSSTTIVDNTANFPAYLNGSDGFAYTCVNKSQVVQTDALGRARYKQSYIVAVPNAHTLNLASDSGADGGSAVIFKQGDTYEIWKVKTVLDQAGQGKGKLLTGSSYLGGKMYFSGTTTPASYPQAGFPLEPCYSWNNIVTSTQKKINFTTGLDTVHEGRDFFNDTKKPGYVPYTYPHPLTKGIVASNPAPSPPSNLQVVPGS